MDVSTIDEHWMFRHFRTEQKAKEYIRAADPDGKIGLICRPHGGPKSELRFRVATMRHFNTFK